MPSTIAPGVFMSSCLGRPKAAMTALMTPCLSRSTCHAIVLSRKFIHIGSMITKMRNPCFPYLLSLKIIAIGKAMIRHMAVLIRASRRDSRRACM